jgi:hypothetical protein
LAKGVEGHPAETRVLKAPVGSRTLSTAAFEESAMYRLPSGPKVIASGSKRPVLLGTNGEASTGFPLALKREM